MLDYTGAALGISFANRALFMLQVKSGGWVGSSLIHLGDSNVPNALMFIDKYSQVRHRRTLPIFTVAPIAHAACGHHACVRISLHTPQSGGC